MSAFSEPRSEPLEEASNSPLGPPPAYTASEHDQANFSQPLADAAAAFSRLELSDDIEDPGVDTCLAHLRLLHAFQAMKEDVGYTDGLWGLWDTRADLSVIVEEDGLIDEVPVDVSTTLTDDQRSMTLSKIREKRWALFVARAGERYEAWWKSLFKVSLTEADISDWATYCESEATEDTDTFNWSHTPLPPLDVLMVLHSHMLNPRAFLEDCMRYGARKLWKYGMPWTQINAAIDDNFSYNVPKRNQSAWEAQTHRAWSSVHDGSVYEMRCPACRVDNAIPWTTCDFAEHPKESEWRPGLVGNGFGDRELLQWCTSDSCGMEISKELLSVSKFVNDCKSVLAGITHMPGTILDPKDGFPYRMSFKGQKTEEQVTFPNRLIRKSSLRSQILELITPGALDAPTMEDVRKLIEGLLESQPDLRAVEDSPSWLRTVKLTREARISIRKMLSHYWDNWSPFVLELGGAVMRQGVFVDKMVKIDWLHSPSKNETIARLLTKYNRFFAIMAENPLRVAVPTLDVDLAWHTHQLCPAAYYRYSKKKTMKFIDHDDKIDEGKLSLAFEWTSKVYQETYKEVYSECTCWYCEAIRASHVSTVGRLAGKLKVAQPTHDKVSESFYESDAAQLCNPEKAAHISAHNAVKVREPTKESVQFRVYEKMRERHQRKLDENYAKACKRAEKKGRRLPPKDQYYDHWGYSYAMYAPYYPLYISPGIYYGSDPCSVTPGEGNWANCANGSCGGAGGCGNGSGACGGGGGGGAGAVTCGNTGGGCGAGCGGGGCGGGGGGC